MIVIVNPVVVTLSFSKDGISAKDEDGQELAFFTVVPISENQLKFYMEDKRDGLLYELIFNRNKILDIIEPVETMLKIVNLTCIEKREVGA